LKACESFKEKVFFCCKISAARNENSCNNPSVFPFLISFCPHLVLTHAQERGLTPHAAGSILESVEAVASYSRNGKDLSPPRLPLLQLLLLSLLDAAGVFLDRIASFES
jgi:hypothetical protein